MAQARKTRSDKRVKTIEKELGVTLRKPDGKRQPPNKKLGTIRKEEAPKTADEKKAAKRVVKSHPKEDKALTKSAEKYFRTKTK